MDRRALAYGASVCVIDRGAHYEGKVRVGAGFGGTCVNVGCIPKKMMWTAAMHRELTLTLTLTLTNANPNPNPNPDPNPNPKP